MIIIYVSSVMSLYYFSSHTFTLAAFFHSHTFTLAAFLSLCLYRQHYVFTCIVSLCTHGYDCYMHTCLSQNICAAYKLAFPYQAHQILSCLCNRSISYNLLLGTYHTCHSASVSLCLIDIQAEDFINEVCIIYS